MSRALFLATWLFTLVAVTCPGAMPAWAGKSCEALSSKQRKQYHSLAEQGDEAARAERWDEAFERYREALAICDLDPALDFRMGRVHELRGDCEVALQTYRSVVQRLEEGAESALDLPSARKRLAEATQACSTARLEVECVDSGVLLSLDTGRASFPCPFAGQLQTGTFRLTAERDGFEPVVQTVVLPGGKTVNVSVPALMPVMEVSEEDDGGGLVLAGWVTSGVGLVAVAAGSVCMALASEERARVEDPRVVEGVVVSITHAGAYAAQDKANLYDTVGIAALTVGGALIATGIVLVVLDAGEDGGTTAIVAPAFDRAGGGLVLTAPF